MTRFSLSPVCPGERILRGCGGRELRSGTWTFSIGLTQWAYGDAGVEIPRLAQEQGVGVQVSPQDVLPGDLLVWDGHVAMYIGNGQIVEAGDPVAVSGLRTDNIGMSFHGFYRPTG